MVTSSNGNEFYTLDELLAQCDPTADRTKEEHEWVADKPVGEELI